MRKWSQKSKNKLKVLIVGVLFLFSIEGICQEGNIRFGRATNLRLPFHYEGDFNSAFGSNALDVNHSGYQNTAIGAFALNYASVAEEIDFTSSGNTGFGFQALYFNTTGSNNTANGSRVLYSNTTGTNNVTSGYELYVGGGYCVNVKK